MSCLEEVCGACSMVINGTARQSCAALVDKLEQPIRLEPMDTFPVVRDLIVDRERMFDALKQIKAWIPIDGTYEDRKSTRLNSSHVAISYAVFCLKKKNKQHLQLLGTYRNLLEIAQ